VKGEIKQTIIKKEKIKDSTEIEGIVTAGDVPIPDSAAGGGQEEEAAEEEGIDIV